MGSDSPQPLADFGVLSGHVWNGRESDPAQQVTIFVVRVIFEHLMVLGCG
jgi:hypothetical protein